MLPNEGVSTEKHHLFILFKQAEHSVYWSHPQLHPLLHLVIHSIQTDVGLSLRSTQQLHPACQETGGVEPARLDARPLPRTGWTSSTIDDYITLFMLM